MRFAVAPSRFLVKQTSAKSTGCRALRRKASESVDREVVLSGCALKARRWSRPPIECTQMHVTWKNQLTSM